MVMVLMEGGGGSCGASGGGEAFKSLFYTSDSNVVVLAFVLALELVVEAPAAVAVMAVVV